MSGDEDVFSSKRRVTQLDNLGESEDAAVPVVDPIAAAPHDADANSTLWRVAALTGLDTPDQPGEAEPTRVVSLGAEVDEQRRAVTVARLDSPRRQRSTTAARRQVRRGTESSSRSGDLSESPSAARRQHSSPKGDTEARHSRRRSARAESAEADPVAVAREICLRLLTERPRTRHELARALRRRRVPDEVAAAVLDRFDDVGLINDVAFAEQWTYSRHTHRGLGRRAIAAELRRKGVDDEIVREALAAIDSESERERARVLVERKLRSMPVDTADQRARAARRLLGMLARKGYGASIAYEVVRAVLAEAGADIEEFSTVYVDET